MIVQVLSHVPYDSIYGAGTSLRNHYATMENNRSIVFNHISRTPNRKLFSSASKPALSSNIATYSSAPLPISFNWDGSDDGKFKFQREFFSRILFQHQRLKIINLIQSNQPDILHINSLALAPVLGIILKTLPHLKVVAHVRELLSTHLTSEQLSDFLYIDAFVSIDKSAKDRLHQVVPFASDKISVIVQNPFRSVSHKFSSVKNLNNFSHKIKIGIAGQITEDKGVLFVMESILASKNPDIHLLIAGESKGNYGDKVLTLCRDHSEYFTYLGQVNDLNASGFYNYIDLIIRGDDSFRTGRTVFEALYSGKMCILPGKMKDINADPNLALFARCLIVYEAQSTNSLVAILNEITHEFIRGTEPDVSGNFNKYAGEIINIYDDLLQ